MLITFESEAIVYLIGKLPTSRQRSNARKRVKDIASESFYKQIEIEQELLRSLMHESDTIKRNVRSKITSLEIERNKIIGGEYGF